MPLCPVCGSRTNRVHRRTRDRLRSIVNPANRYRCSSEYCAWEGNLKSGKPLINLIIKWVVFVIAAAIIGKIIVR